MKENLQHTEIKILVLNIKEIANSFCCLKSSTSDGGGSELCSSQTLMNTGHKEAQNHDRALTASTNSEVKDLDDNTNNNLKILLCYTIPHFLHMRF